MAIARSKIFNPKEAGYYHCIVRCVRRSYLCGYDKVTGKDFEHRREWIKKRLTHLLEVFAIDCFSYAVMSNHLHLVIRNNPDVVKGWSNQEVAIRWRKLFSKYRQKEEYDEDIKRISEDEKLVEEYRLRLSSISWFNRCMNENIAKMANKEDDCKGRFWEGRFISQKLESVNAVIACGIYVDLNPIRAKMAETPEESDFTSIQDRIIKFKETNIKQNDEVGNNLSQNSSQKIECEVMLKNKAPKLIPINEKESFPITEEEYICLVDMAGRISKRGKRGTINPALKPILERLKINSDYFIENILENGFSLSKMFTYIIGDINEINSFTKKLKQNFMHGISSAKAVFNASCS